MDARNYSASDTLKDGSQVTVRAIQTSDRAGILAAFKSMDRELIYRRFFAPKRELSNSELDGLADVDFHNVVALVMTRPGKDGEVLIGGGRFALGGDGSAELAFVTDGAHRGLGVASLILRHLTEIAREAGVRGFDAEVLAENQSMLAVFRRSGLPMSLKRDGSVLHVKLDLGAARTA